LQVDKALVTAVAVPVVLGLVWLGLRRIKRRMG
jgi:uncharacterized membrane-anchored protein